MSDLSPNTRITLKMLLTIPVTVDRGERKLKLIKTYLRSTLDTSRILSIENEIAQNMDSPEIINIPTYRLKLDVILLLRYKIIVYFYFLSFW